MVEQSQLQELMSRLLFKPMSGNSVGVEIWHRDTLDNAIVPGMDDDAFVTEWKGRCADMQSKDIKKMKRDFGSRSCKKSQCR